MKLIEAQKRIEKLAYIPFKEYLTEEQFNNIVVNKGKTGQILELTIGLQLSNTTLDFEDGELKTNKCNKLGIPAETMFITQTASIIDELLSFKPFEESKLYKKINRMLYVRINKEGAPENWMFLPPILVDLSLPKYAELATQLKFDYIDICDILNDQLCLSPYILQMESIFKSERKIPFLIMQFIQGNMTESYQTKIELFILKFLA